MLLLLQADLLTLLEYNMLNSSVAFVGYYVAAYTIDLPYIGRRRMQVFPLGLDLLPQPCPFEHVTLAWLLRHPPCGTSGHSLASCASGRAHCLLDTMGRFLCPPLGVMA